MSTANKQGIYSGVDNLEVMASAHNYNKFLTELAYGVSSKREGEKLEVLDFGAGSGTFCSSLSKLGLNIICVEPDKKLRESLIENGFICYENIHEITDGSVDYIYSFNVLEHIEDDASAVSEIYRVLRPGGIILLYLPAFQCLFSAMDIKVGHFRRYRRKQLEAVVSRAGFVTTRSEYVDSLGFFAALLYRYVGDSEGDINAKSLALFDKYVFPLSRLADVLFNKWFGKNVLVVACKHV